MGNAGWHGATRQVSFRCARIFNSAWLSHHGARSVLCGIWRLDAPIPVARCGTEDSTHFDEQPDKNGRQNAESQQDGSPFEPVDPYFPPLSPHPALPTILARRMAVVMTQRTLKAVIAITAWTEVLHGWSEGWITDPGKARPMTRKALFRSLLVAHDRSFGRRGGRLDLLEFRHGPKAWRFGFAGAAAGGGYQRDGAGGSGGQGTDHGRHGLRGNQKNYFDGWT
jgi:hypothetical protein